MSASLLYEDELASLLKLVGVERIIMGPDHPRRGPGRACGLHQGPENFDYTPEQCRTVMRDNGIELSVRRPV